MQSPEWLTAQGRWWHLGLQFLFPRNVCFGNFCAWVLMKIYNFYVSPVSCRTECPFGCSEPQVTAVCHYLVELGLWSQGLFVLVIAILFFSQSHRIACLKRSLVLVHGPGRSFSRDGHSNHRTQSRKCLPQHSPQWMDRWENQALGS